MGCVPWGWRVGVDGVHLDPCPEDLAVAKRALELRASGLSFAKVAVQLAAEGLTTRTGRPFLRTEVHALCRREITPARSAVM